MAKSRIYNFTGLQTVLKLHDIVTLRKTASVFSFTSIRKVLTWSFEMIYYNVGLWQKDARANSNGKILSITEYF